MGIRGRLLILVVGVAIPLTLVGAIVLRGMWKVMQAQLDDSVKQQAELASTAFQRWVDEQRQPLMTIAIVKSNPNFHLVNFSRELLAIVQTQPHWIDLRVVDSAGQDVIVEPSGGQPMAPALIDYLLSEMHRHGTWALATDRTRDESFPVFTISAQIQGGGAVIARIDGSAMHELFSNIELSNHGVIAVFDSQGQVLFRKPTPRISADAEVSFVPLVQTLSDQQSTVTEIESPYDAVRRIYGLARAGTKDGPVVVVGIPSATLYESAQSRFLTYIYFSLLALACAVAAALLIARSIVRPIRRLQQAAHEFGAGNMRVQAPVTGTTEISELGVSFNKMAAQIYEREERLKELDLLKSEFVSSVSHELRTPLTTIKTLTHVLQRGGETKSERREHLETIAAECDRQIDLVVNLLDLSRIESGAYSVSLTKVDPKEIVLSSVMRERHAAETRRQNLQADLPTELPAVRADKTALQRVLCGLIENAIKYTPDGGEITVGASSSENKVAIKVSDSGYGISAKDLPHIFEKFYRGNFAIGPEGLTESFSQSGVGLGLYLARKVVGQMDGQLSVESRADQGTTFTISLPLWPREIAECQVNRQEGLEVEEATRSR